MKGLFGIVALAVVVSVSVAGPSQAPAVQQPVLLVAGPVESISQKDGTVTVLGQKLLIGRLGISVGNEVLVYGNVRSDGSFAVSKVTDKGTYAAGATPVLLTGVVQQVHASIGRAKVSGVDVDLTSVSAAGGASLQLSAGSWVQVLGTQPVNKGVVLVEAIAVGGKSSNGVVGGGLNGVVGGGLNGVVGGGLNGVVGGGLNGVVGGGLNGVVGGGLNGVVGGGLNGVVGGGHGTNGVVGGGH